MPAAISSARSGGVSASASHRDQGRQPQSRQVRPRIGAAEDGRLLAQEGVAADPFGHGDHRLPDRPGKMVRMHKLRQQPRRDALELPAAGQRHQPAAPARLVRRIGPGRGIEQRQPGDPARRLAQHLEGQIATHRQPGQGEAGRRRRQGPGGHRRQGVVERHIRDQAARRAGEAGDLGLPERGIAEQAGEQEQVRVFRAWATAS